MHLLVMRSLLSHQSRALIKSKKVNCMRMNSLLKIVSFMEWMLHDRRCGMLKFLLFYLKEVNKGIFVAFNEI